MPDVNGLLCRPALVVVEECAAGACSCRGRARTRWRHSWGCATGAASCGSVLFGLRSGARLEVLLQRRRLLRLDHRRPDVAHTRPHGAGCPGTGPVVAISIYVRPVRAAEALQSPAASCRLGSRCEYHTVGGVLPPTFSAGWEQPALQDAPLALACARRPHWRRPRNRRQIKLRRHGCRRSVRVRA